MNQTTRQNGSSVTQQDIARAAGVERTTVAKILNEDPNFSFSPDTVRRVRRLAHDLGYDFSRITSLRRRRMARVDLDVPADVTLRLVDGEEWCTGRCVVRDVTVKGALLGRFDLPDGRLPARFFHLEVRPREGALADRELHGPVVRFAYEQSEFSVGIAFEDLDDDTRRVLQELASRE